MIQMILLLVNIFEVAESYLAVDIVVDENISTSPLQISYAWMSFVSTVAMIAFIRMCEMFDKSGERDVNTLPNALADNTNN